MVWNMVEPPFLSTVAAAAGRGIRAGAEVVCGLAAADARPGAEAPPGRPRDDGGVSYAVVWREDVGPVYAGRLDLSPCSLRLSGAASEVRSQQQLLYRDLADVHIERRPRARLAQLPTLVLECRDGSVVHLASVQGLGSLHELAEEIEAARADPPA
jgi:hypothetical protein